MTRRILVTALISAAAAAAVVGVPATADDPTPTATASAAAPTAAETAPAEPTPAPTEAPTEAPTQTAQDTPTATPTETATEAPTETPFPSPVDTTIATPAPTETAAAADATATATATATPTATETPRKRKRAANQSSGKNGQARECTEKDTGKKASTSTSASGCVKTDEPKSLVPPVHVPKLTNVDGSPASSNPSYALSVPGPAKIGVPNFFIDKFRIPPFLLPIYQAAGMQYGIRWEVLAGINEIETDYGRNLNVSSAGALGWMQFMPATWKSYGVDANQDGVKDPFNPVDAIFAAARYLKAAGGETDLRKAVFAYNHADWYVDSVLMRAQVIGGIPGDLVGSLTGLTQGRFPVRAKATYAGALKKADRKTKGTNAAVTVESDTRRRNIEIYAKAGSPVIAVNDGKVIKLGASKRLGRYIVVQDVYGNIYTYGHLAKVAKTYPSPKRRTRKADSDTGSKRRGVKTAAPKTEHEAPADAKAAEEAAPPPRSPPPRPPRAPRSASSPTRSARTPSSPAATPRSPADGVELASAGAPLGLNPKDFVAKRLVKGAHVLGGTTLGRIGKTSDDQGSAPAVRDPPGRPRRPAHRPEADPRRLEAARVHRGLPRQGQERAVRLRRRGALDRPDHADEQGDPDPPRARRPPDRALRLRPRRHPLRRRSTAASWPRSSSSPLAA